MRRLGVALALLLALAGCGVAPDAPASSPGTAGTATARPGEPDLTPASIEIPSIGAESSLIGLGMDADGGWAEPDLKMPGQASWYDLGPPPGAVGPAVVLGHINGGGRPGVFARLAELTPGAEIVVRARSGTVTTFTVTRVQVQVDKEAFPAEAVLGPTEDRAIRLITCGGRLDKVNHRYLDSTIVYGVATSQV